MNSTVGRLRALAKNLETAASPWDSASPSLLPLALEPLDSLFSTRLPAFQTPDSPIPKKTPIFSMRRFGQAEFWPIRHAPDFLHQAVRLPRVVRVLEYISSKDDKVSSMEAPAGICWLVEKSCSAADAT